MNKSLCLVVLAAVILCVASEVKESTVGPRSSAEFRAQQALNGLMDYYWIKDPDNKNISFFFACGQIGGVGDFTKCTCLNPESCVTCFRWWDAVSVESVATYGIYTNTTNHSSTAGTVFDHSPYNADYNGPSTYIDDFAWYGIAYLRVYEWLNVSGK